MADYATQQQIVELQQAVTVLQQQLHEAKQQQLHEAKHNGDRGVPFPLKPVAPDTYDGTSAPTSWLHQLRVYFSAWNMDMKDSAPATRFAASLLRGPAALWWKQHLDATEMNVAARINDWETFTNALIARFQTVNATAVARDRLSHLRQIGRVRDFVNHFQRVCSEIPGITEDEMMDRFCRGLKRSVRQQVEALKAVHEDKMTLTKLFNLAERLDAAEASNAYQPRTWNSPAPRDSSHNSFKRAGPAPGVSEDTDVVMSLNAMNNKTSRSKLTDQEKKQLMQDGRCFYCKEKGHLAARCPNKNQKNF